MKKKIYEMPELKVHRVELTHMIANSIGDEEEMARQFSFEEDGFEAWPTFEEKKPGEEFEDNEFEENY